MLMTDPESDLLIGEDELQAVKVSPVMGLSADAQELDLAPGIAFRLASLHEHQSARLEERLASKGIEHVQFGGQFRGVWSDPDVPDELIDSLAARFVEKSQ
jgi:hypothetical protein